MPRTLTKARSLNRRRERRMEAHRHARRRAADLSSPTLAAPPVSAPTFPVVAEDGVAPSAVPAAAPAPVTPDRPAFRRIAVFGSLDATAGRRAAGPPAA